MMSKPEIYYPDCPECRKIIRRAKHHLQAGLDVIAGLTIEKDLLDHVNFVHGKDLRRRKVAQALSSEDCRMCKDFNEVLRRFGGIILADMRNKTAKAVYRETVADFVEHVFLLHAEEILSAISVAE